MLKSINIANSAIGDEKLNNKCYVKLEKLSVEKIAHETRLSRKENEPVEKRPKGRPKRIYNDFSSPPLKRICATSNENTNKQGLITQSGVDVLDDPRNPVYDKKWSSEDFSIGKEVGRGRFGRCYLVKEKRSKFECLFVLKKLSKNILIKNNAKSSLKQEYENQRALSHPNILRVYGFFDEPEQINLILEYAPNGTLYDRILNKLVDNNKAAKYAYQTTRALIYLHSHHIIHRDLKPENLLLGYFDEIKLADFGWSFRLATNTKDKCIAGTIDYLCPEMLEHKSHDTKVDNWCLGVLCYELLVGSAPFHNADYKKTYELIKQVSYTKEIIPNVFARNLVDRLLKHNPDERMKLDEVVSHDWIQIYADKSNEYEKYYVY